MCQAIAFFDNSSFEIFLYGGYNCNIQLVIDSQWRCQFRELFVAIHAPWKVMLCGFCFFVFFFIWKICVNWESCSESRIENMKTYNITDYSDIRNQENQNNNELKYFIPTITWCKLIIKSSLALVKVKIFQKLLDRVQIKVHQEKQTHLFILIPYL